MSSMLCGCIYYYKLDRKRGKRYDMPVDDVPKRGKRIIIRRACKQND